MDMIHSVPEPARPGKIHGLQHWDPGAGHQTWPPNPRVNAQIRENRYESIRKTSGDARQHIAQQRSLPSVRDPLRTIRDQVNGVIAARSYQQATNIDQSSPFRSIVDAQIRALRAKLHGKDPMAWVVPCIDAIEGLLVAIDVRPFNDTDFDIVGRREQDLKEIAAAINTALRME